MTPESFVMMNNGRYIATGSSKSGGMGDIEIYNDTHLDRLVVIKRLQSGIATRRIVDEQLALSKLRSKHVVQLFDIIVSDDTTRSIEALVLEHIPGNDLEPSSFVYDEHFLRTLWQIACGIRDIHNAGIIHRDIKPNNIRVNADGVIKILDFGLARTEGLQARTQNIIGTPGYMAPELWSDHTVSFDSAIDVYAFGVLVIALLGVQVPPQILASPPQPVTAIDVIPVLAGLPNELADLIGRCLNYDPTLRPTMNILASSIGDILLKDKHRALVVYNRAPLYCDCNNRSINMAIPSVGALTIHYDGLNYICTICSGLVTVNNRPVSIGMIVPNCCVITFGAAGAGRKFVTFDVSNPEVMP